MNTAVTDPSNSDRLTKFLEHADWLHGLALHLVRDGHEAEDVFQEALLAASSGAVPSGVPARAWLSGILQNVARARRRRGRNRSERERLFATERGRVTGGGTTSGAAVDAAELESQRRLLDQVESLPDAQRSAVLARYFEGLPPRKIALRYGVPVSTVNSRIQRGLETLRKQLDDEHGDRRTWAIWILPIVRRGALLTAPAVLAGALATAIALALGAGMWMLLSSPSDIEKSSAVDRSSQLDDVAVTDSDTQLGPIVSSTSRQEIAVRQRPVAPSAAGKPKGPQLSVRVRNQAGQFLNSGLTVGANARVDLPPFPGRSIDGLDEFLSAPLEGGIAAFGNHWERRTVHGVENGPSAWKLFEIHRVYIDGPGLAEFEPGASSSVAFFPKKPGEPLDLSCALVLPPCGSVRLEISDSNGQQLRAAGTASLAFPGVPQHPLGGERSYSVPILDGIAEWRGFVTGSRSFVVRLDVPSLGASWSVEGVGPESAREAVTIKAHRPRRPAITARLVDEDRQPLEIERIDLTFTTNSQYPYSGFSVRASSDATGAVRFEIPHWKGASGSLPPFSMHGFRFNVVGGHGGYKLATSDAIRLWGSSPGTFELGADLGEVLLRFEARVELHGQVKDSEGAPIAGAEVTVRTSGASGQVGPTTDALGRFTMSAPVREGSTMRVVVPNGIYLEQVRDMPVGVKEVSVVLERGASLYGSIHTEGIPLPDRAISIALQHEAEAGTRRSYWPEGDGRFGGGPIPPGTYTATVKHQGGQTIATVPGIEFGTSGRVSDERLNGIRLIDHFRVVPTTWSGVPKHGSIQYIVEPHVESEPRRFILIGDLGRGLVLPTRLSGSVTFQSMNTFVEIDDVASIGDSLHVAFNESIELVLLIDGQPRASKKYSLRGEPGTGADGYTAALSEDSLRGGRCEVKVPMAGSYRFHMSDRPRLGGGGLAFQSIGSEPIGEPFEVLTQGADGNPQTISLSL